MVLHKGLFCLQDQGEVKGKGKQKERRKAGMKTIMRRASIREGISRGKLHVHVVDGPGDDQKGMH